MEVAGEPPGVLQRKVTYQAEHVFVQSSKDRNTAIPGCLCLVEKGGDYSIQWLARTKSAQAAATSSALDQAWTLVNAVGYHNDSEQRGSTPSSPQQQEQLPLHRTVDAPQAEEPALESDSLYIIRHIESAVSFELAHLRSLRRCTPNFRASRLQFILDDGTTTPYLIFQKGGSMAFVERMQGILPLKEAVGERGLYLVVRPEVEALSRSFEELQLFSGSDASSLALRFWRDPYSLAMSGLAKVTKFVHETLMTEEDVNEDSYVNLETGKLVSATVEPKTAAGCEATARPVREPPAAAAVQSSLPTVDAHNEEDPEYAFINARAKLPLKPKVDRSPPLTMEVWRSFFDSAGRLHETDAIRELIFRGGLCPEVRCEAWKFLLGYYRWNATDKERDAERKQKVDDYFRMKLQWKTVTEDQMKRFSLFSERKALIEKDVNRTDRTHRFYAGENNENLTQLSDILMTYVMFNFDLGYVQGMSDLLSPILVVMENEVDAFWCFEGFMKQLSSNFELDQKGMKRQLQDLNRLLQAVDPDLFGYLEDSESSNMYFAFRWLLVLFKREFSMADIMRLWEVFWTGLPCPNFHLLIACAILSHQRAVIVEGKLGFTEILKHVNDLSGQIDLDEMLKEAEVIYMQLSQCPNLPDPLVSVLGLARDAVDASTAGAGAPAAESQQLLQPAAAAAGAEATVPPQSEAAAGDCQLSAETAQPFS